ncbi:MAG: CvpA family protein [Candidatus Omnitrophica bacterium]|nr:CvpA family protein [Candidatus Omnitrophota bacterium]
MPEILRQINWVDISIFVIICRVIFIAQEKGLAVESFKLLGTILATYLSLHYFVQLANFLRGNVILGSIPEHLFYFPSLLLLSTIGYLFFAFLRKLLIKFLKLEEAPGLNKWGGVILGALRSLLLSGLIIFILVFSSSAYLEKSIRNSYSANFFYRVPSAVYSAIWNGLLCKLISNESFNNMVLDFGIQKKKEEKK